MVTPSRAEALMPPPSPTPFHRLRKVSLHLWAYWTSLAAQAAFVLRLSKSGNSVERAAAVESLVRTTLDVGTALDQGPPAGRVGILRSIGLNMRSFHYDRIIGPLVMLPDDLRAALSQDDLKRIMHFAELSLAYYQAGTERAFTKPRTGPSRIRALQRLCLGRALHHTMLANAYVQLEVGDPAQNLESAFEHYRSAAIILEQEAPLALSLYAANAWRALGAAQLSYPTENRAHYARRAIEAFSAAKRIVAPRAAGIEAPPEIMTDQTAWEKLPYVTRARYAAQYVLRLQRSRWKVVRTGVPEPLMSGMMVPFFAAKIDWQLGIAHRHLGQLGNAVEHLTRAVGGFTQGGEHFRAGVEVDIGYAYLEAQTGDRQENLRLAASSFHRAMTASVEKGFVKEGLHKAYALALIGDARVYFEQESLGAIAPARRATVYPILVDELRTAARIARGAPALPLLHEALFLLGKTYALQQDSARAYWALALAARVGDRLQKRARTPRLSHFYVGTQARLYDLLAVTAFECVCAAGSAPGQAKAKPSVSVDRVFSFAEHGRTVFLQTQLANLTLLPQGAAREDLQEFFEQRRLWHKAELRLLEHESTQLADDTPVREMESYRNRCEFRYRSELESVRARFNDPDYDPDQPIFSVRFVDFYPTLLQYLQKERAALVEYYLTSRGLMVFVLFPTKLTAQFIGISVAELKAIEARWQEGYETLSSSVTYWEQGYLGQVLDRVKRAVVVPAKTIRDWEQKTGGRIERVVIVPHRFLHRVPLHAIQIEDGTPWGDMVSIRYVPSAGVLWQLLRKRGAVKAEPVTLPDDPEGRGTVAIAYPGEPPLLFCGHEARAVVAATGGRLLEGRDATPRRVKEALEGATYIHFCCHGEFDSAMPLDAALKLAPDTESATASGAAPHGASQGDGGSAQQHADGRLTLAEILQDLRLSAARLVVLSACETGLTKIEQRHDEYIGLPAGFLYAGATTVVTSLWKVNDIATWLLMGELAQEVAAGVPPPAALWRAQQKLRGLSGEHITQQVARAAEAESDASRREQMIAAELELRQLGEFPFAGPYWWAGFTVNGL